jgi:hypothetical protein
MKKNSSAFVLVLTALLVISLSSVQAAKYEWYFEVNATGAQAEMFTVSKDNQFVQLTVEVFEGGPVHVYVLDNDSYQIWSGAQPYPPPPDDYVIALFGEANISEGTKMTIDGYLGYAYNFTVRSVSTGETTEVINGTTYTTTLYDVRTSINDPIPYYLIVDNTDGVNRAYVDVTVVATVDAISAISTLSAIILVAAVFAKRKKWKKPPF